MVTKSVTGRSTAHSVHTTGWATTRTGATASRPSTRSGSPGARSAQTAAAISSYAPPNLKLTGPNAEELEQLIKHYDALLEARDNNISQLTVQLESEQRRAAMLESELSLALAASSRAEAAHGSELAKVEGDVARVLAERRGLLDKLQSIEVVEDAVREMVVQMKMRVGDDDIPSPEQLQAEKEALRDENILTVLGSLKAILKSLWKFKVEAEEDMRCSRTGRQQQHAQQVLGLKAHIRHMEAAVRQAQQEQAAARSLAEEETAAREAVLAESQAVLAQMEVQNRDVLVALKAATEEAAAARRALAAAQEEGRKRDTLVLKNQQLESARHFDRVAQDRELRAMQTEHTRQITSMQSELARIGDLMARNDTLRDQLRTVLHSREQMRAEVRAAKHAVELADRQQRFGTRSQLDTASQMRSASANPYGRAASASAASARSAPSTVARLMASRRATAQEQAKQAAEEAEEADPIYNTLANVHKLHRNIRGTIKDMKKELTEASPSSARGLSSSRVYR